MKRKNFLKIGVMLLVSVIWISCFKDNSGDFKVYTDVFTINKRMNNEPVHALAYYAYGNQMMKNATVSRIGGLGDDIDMGINQSSIYVMSKEPQASDFKPYQEQAGAYLFKIVSEGGVTVQDTDYLDPQNLGIPSITAVVFSVNKKIINLTWTPVSNADATSVKVTDSTGVYIFASESLDPNTITYTLNSLGNNWTKRPNSGETYYIQVQAFQFEKDADPSYQIYNVEELSIGERKIVWE